MLSKDFNAMFVSCHDPARPKILKPLQMDHQQITTVLLVTVQLQQPAIILFPSLFLPTKLAPFHLPLLPLQPFTSIMSYQPRHTRKDMHLCLDETTFLSLASAVTPCLHTKTKDFLYIDFSNSFTPHSSLLLNFQMDQAWLSISLAGQQ